MNTKKTKLSATAEINSLAQERMRKGLPVFNLGAGEPILDAFSSVQRAGIRAIQQNKTLYPEVAGLPELRAETAAWLNSEYKTSFRKENILVTNGGKLGIFLSLQTLLGEGDEVIIPAPFWVSYPSMVELFGGKAKIVQTTPEAGWKMTSKQLRKACTKRTKVLILNNACNPTGALYTREEILGLLKVAEEKNLIVISDEVYSGLVFDDEKFVSCASFPKFKKRVIVIQSCSKNFAMTGWRVGFVCAEKELIRTLTNLVSQSTSGVTTISQWAALEAIKNRENITPVIRKEMEKRRNLMVGLLEKHFHIKLVKPASSLYLFVDMKDLGLKEGNSALFCKRTLKKTGIVIVPGSAFGKEGFVRLTFGPRPEVIKKAITMLISSI